MTANLRKCWKPGVLAVFMVTLVLVCGLLPSYYDVPGDGVFRVPPPQTENDLLYLTIHTNDGRLGNQMFTFATLYGLCALNDRQILAKPRMQKVLKEYFDVNYHELNERTFVESNPWNIRNWLTDADRFIPKDTNIIKGNMYPTSYTFFDHVRQHIRSIFRFKEEYKKHAQDALRDVKKLRPWTQVYVGVHVRRGDYISKQEGGWLRAYEGREVDDEFFSQAVSYFTSRYPNATFVAVSEDREWCRTNLLRHDIITLPDSPSAGHDLALLAECNHTIMTYGTYGFWGGYLAGGEVVYFTDFLKPNTSMVMNYFRYEKMYPPDWVGINTTKPGYWETYKNPFL